MPQQGACVPSRLEYPCTAVSPWSLKHAQIRLVGVQECHTLTVAVTHAASSATRGRARCSWAGLARSPAAAGRPPTRCVASMKHDYSSGRMQHRPAAAACLGISCLDAGCHRQASQHSSACACCLPGLAALCSSCARQCSMQQCTPSGNASTHHVSTALHLHRCIRRPRGPLPLAWPPTQASRQTWHPGCTRCRAGRQPSTRQRCQGHAQEHVIGCGIMDWLAGPGCCMVRACGSSTCLQS